MKDYANTAVYRGKDDALVVKLHDTEIVSIEGNASHFVDDINKGNVRFNHGGWKSPTTKKRINEAASLVVGGHGWEVYQKDFEWYIKRDNGDVYHWEGQFITFPIDPNKVVLKMRNASEGGGWYMETDD